MYTMLESLIKPNVKVPSLTSLGEYRVDTGGIVRIILYRSVRNMYGVGHVPRQWWKQHRPMQENAQGISYKCERCISDRTARQRVVLKSTPNIVVLKL